MAVTVRDALSLGGLQRGELLAGAAGLDREITWVKVMESPETIDWLAPGELLLTVAFAIGITRYRLMQLDQLLSSGFVYFLVSFLAGLVYYGLAFIGLFLVNSRGGEGPSLLQAFLVSSTASAPPFSS